MKIGQALAIATMSTAALLGMTAPAIAAPNALMATASAPSAPRCQALQVVPSPASFGRVAYTAQDACSNFTVQLDLSIIERRAPYRDVVVARGHCSTGIGTVCTAHADAPRRPGATYRPFVRVTLLPPL